MSTIATGHDPIDFRLSPQHQAILEQAAAIAGQSLSDFATATLLQKAREILRMERVLQLSERDALRFLELLDADTEPNESLKHAAQRNRSRHA